MGRVGVEDGSSEGIDGEPEDGFAGGRIEGIEGRDEDGAEALGELDGSTEGASIGVLVGK